MITPLTNSSLLHWLMDEQTAGPHLCSGCSADSVSSSVSSAGSAVLTFDLRTEQVEQFLCCSVYSVFYTVSDTQLPVLSDCSSCIWLLAEFSWTWSCFNESVWTENRGNLWITDLTANCRIFYLCGWTLYLLCLSLSAAGGSSRLTDFLSEMSCWQLREETVVGNDLIKKLILKVTVSWLHVSVSPVAVYTYVCPDLYSNHFILEFKWRFV